MRFILVFIFTSRFDLNLVQFHLEIQIHCKTMARWPRTSVLAVCFLVCAALAKDCDWDLSTDPDQILDLASLDHGANHMEQVPVVSDAESCRAACCNKTECDLALVGYPADGGPQCLLVKCWIDGRDQCVLRSSGSGSQVKIYRRKVNTNTDREAREDGQRLKIVPLLGAWEPLTNDTNEIEQINNIRCRLPMKVGSCRAAFPKFYYDVTNQSCRRFIYGGCEANGNNFASQDECEATCSGVTGSVLPDDSTPAPPQLPVKAARMAPALRINDSQDAEATAEPAESTQETGVSAEAFAERCWAEPQVGPCRAAFQHWYYNKETGSCQSFIYGGCRGNKNNYVSKESCMAACTVTVLPSSKKAAAADEASTENEDHCVATPDPGPCRAALPMFYHDPSTSTCQPFMYGGCRGNKNRYGTVEECMSRCKVYGYPAANGRARNRWTAGVFLFSTLAAISALLLVTLIVITMRRRSLSRRLSSISDKEELLPDEQSSLESLSIPESPRLDKA